MRLEAISQLLGHKTLEMTAVYARIADRTVADEYRAVFRGSTPCTRPSLRTRPRRCAVCAGSTVGSSATAGALGPKRWTATSSRSVGLRLLRHHGGVQTDLQRQRNHAADHGHPKRVQTFDRLLKDLEEGAS